MAELKRSLGPVSLTLYGVGVTLGAGIYVLIGETAGYAGSLTPVAFMLALVVALMTSLSYAELGGRYPVSAGEAVYVHEAFGQNWLSRTVGGAVTFTGVFSAATVLQGFSGYAMVLTGAQQIPLITGATLVLALLALWGVKESVWVAAGITVFEVGGLLFVIAMAAPAAVSDPAPFVSAAPLGVLVAASVAFFAFIGFEDIVNMGEEVRVPAKNVPRAVLATMIITGAIYMGVSFVAVRAVQPEVLAQSTDPMAELLRQSGSSGDEVISLIAIVAILNGALINMLMASRVLFGMARKGLLPTFLAAVNEKRQTPHNATILVAVIVLGLALLFPLSGLARTTSFLTLIVFLLVNLSLIRLRQSTQQPIRDESFIAPVFTPYLGVAGSAVLAIAAIAG